MDVKVLWCTFADRDYYEPLHRFRSGRPEYHPSEPPAGWTRTRRGIWTAWDPPGGERPDQGWKIHVSATRDGTGRVLDTVTAVCATTGVPFKHVADEFSFLQIGHKHGVRSQAGKFCAVYPPDEAAARRLLAELADRLADEEGPYILSDRRFRDSRTVHYRYGSFRRRQWVTLDGSLLPLVRDGYGEWVEDVRTHRFVLPPGVADPFIEVSPPAAAVAGGPRIGDYRVVAALAQSNAGGTYRAVDPAGREVVMKEARAHTGYHWDGSTAQERLRREHQVLQELHALTPGLAPEPVAYFRQWEHEFLVIELVPGRPLSAYTAHANPYAKGNRSEAEFAHYFDQCRQWLARLSDSLDHLHQLGYRFGDLNPRNILVTEEGGLRLVDFEACNRLAEPPIRLAAPGFAPTDPRAWEGTGVDEHGLHVVALLLLAPLQRQVVRNPAALTHLAAHLHRRYPPPADLWELAARSVAADDDRVDGEGSHRPAGRARSGSGSAAAGPASGSAAGSPSGSASGDDLPQPTPAELDADPLGYLHRLREGVRRELIATASPDDPDRIWPSVPEGYGSNTWSLAYGAAGVLHALHHSGVAVDEQVVARLRREALARRGELAPGLQVGTAGIGVVLAEYGYVDEAVALVRAARAHPLTGTAGTWGLGSSGVGTALLALHARTGEADLLEQAVRIGEELPLADPVALLGEHNPTGLLHGRAGTALFLHQLWQATGDKRFLADGTGLLHAELDRGVDERGQLLFQDDDVTPRLMPYLAIGSAGMGLVLTRYAQTDRDERLTAALGPVLAAAEQPVTMEAGLYQGLAGLAFVHAEHADLAGSGNPQARERAVRLAAGLALYAVPGPDGRARFLGSSALRFSTELATGAAGVLLALDRILAGPTGQLLFFDAPGREATG
jgi:serine/threonine protein kinase